MLSRRGVLAAALAATGPTAFPRGAAAASAGVLRLGTLPFGTVSWEAEVIRRERLDARHGFTLETLRLAGNEAARIAFQAGQVDSIVSDLLWAARLRNEGRAIRYLPFSATEGAVMVPSHSNIASVGDLRGKRIGVAGGALDKSWLLLRAHATERYSLDLTGEAAPVYGAPPLLTQKLEAGELDAGLLYWNYCARLEAKGFKRLVGAGEIARSFGLTGDIALIGYIVDEQAIGPRLTLFHGMASASREAKAMLASSESTWASVRPLMQAEDEPTYRSLKSAFLEGIPRRSLAAERADAERLYAVLARLGGDRLLGPGSSLPSGLYWGEAKGG
jgi:NitT/TauT family transport system substrate-binding protein